MADRFYEIVKKSQHGDKEAMLSMINTFKPLIKKYSYYLNYDGANSDLIIAFIEIIRKMPINEDVNLKYDKFIVGYISSAIKNRYIYLSKKNYQICLNETELKLGLVSIGVNIKFEDKIFIGEVLDKLSEIQRRVLVLKFVKNYSDVDISKILNISRQSVNRAKNRALKNIRKYIGE